MAALSAAAIPINGCITTARFLFLSNRQSFRRRCMFRLISSSGISTLAKFTTPPLAPSLSPDVTNGRRRIQFSCYGTEIETHNSTESAPPMTVDEDDVRKAANTLDLRVGRVLKAWRHEEADTLYVEEVDIGEPEPRTICSGLVKYMPIHLLQDRNVIVLANLKPRNMRGVKSYGMLMAASDAAHENVELLVPPQGAVPGERVWFGSADEKENLPDAASPNQVQKKKIWELVQPHLKTDDSYVAVLGIGQGYQMRTAAGAVVCESLKNANIS